MSVTQEEKINNLAEKLDKQNEDKVNELKDLVVRYIYEDKYKSQIDNIHSIKAIEAINASIKYYDPNNDKKLPYLQYLLGLFKRNAVLKTGNYIDSEGTNSIDLKSFIKLRKIIQDLEYASTYLTSEEKSVLKKEMGIDEKKLEYLLNLNTLIYPIDLDKDDGEGGGSLIDIIKDSQDSPEVSMLSAMVGLYQIFSYIDQEEKSDDKIEKYHMINTNYMYQLELDNELASYRAFIHRDYNKYHNKNKCTNEDRSIIYYVYFNDEYYRNQELEKTNIYDSKKSSFSTTYRKPYKIHAKEYGTKQHLM